MATTRSIVAVCKECNQKVDLEVDLDEMRRYSKGGIYKFEVSHSGHSTIFFITPTEENLQVRGQVTGESIVEDIMDLSRGQIPEEKAKDIDLILTNFIGVVPEIELVCILDNEGTTIGCKPVAGLPNVKIDRMKIMVHQILEGVTKSFDLISLGTDVFDVGYLRFVFAKAGPDLIIVAISKIHVSADQTLAYCYLAAEKLWRIMDSRSVDLDIPILDVEGPIFAKPDSEQIKYLGIKCDHYLAKLAIVGNASAGKTSLVRRFVENAFDTDYKSTLGVNIMTKTVRFPDEETEMMLTIHDMGGQEQFDRVRKTYFSGTHGCFIVFDVTNRKSFEDVKEWYTQATQYAGLNVSIILLGNKVDLTDERVVSHEEVAALVRELGCPYIETSAKSGENVETAFSLITLFLCDKTEKFLEPTPKIEKAFSFATHALFLHSLMNPLDQYRVLTILIKGNIRADNVINELLSFLEPICEPILLLGPTAPTQLSVPEETKIGWVTTVSGIPELRYSILSAEDPSMVSVFLTKTLAAVPAGRSPVIIGDFLDNMIPQMDRGLFYKFYSDLASTARVLNHTVVFIVKADIHSEENNNVVKHFADVIIENREREENGILIREVRVSNRVDNIHTDWEKY